MLVDRAQVAEPTGEKLKQLMTLPRASKADPPTHLFVGINGDYVRGRLISYADDCVKAEIRLNNCRFSTWGNRSDLLALQSRLG